MHKGLNPDAATKRAARRQPPKLLFKLINPLVALLLRSPAARGLGQELTLITFRGRKSGQQYTTPVNYLREGDTVYFFSDGNWWKNFSGDGGPISLLIQGQRYQGRAEAIVNHKEAIAAIMLKFVQQKGARYASLLDLTLDASGQPDPKEIARAAEHHIPIRVMLAHTS